MVPPPPRLVFEKSLFRFFSPIFKGKFFLGISVLFKGLLLCETMGTFGTFRYLSNLGHFWTIWAMDKEKPTLENSAVFFNIVQMAFKIQVPATI